ncbi:MAG TPA: hypothetical protein VLQ68_06885 [Rhizobiaceae bacterium]|nr:hypothetical protein [Rhizobiaceae bacterium]
MSKKTLIAAAVGTAFVAGMTAAPFASATDNPFAMQSLDRGYMVAQAGKTAEGKCGQGKCGAMNKAAENKCGAAMMDADKDGNVSKDEFIKAHEAMFATMDANKDGSIDKTEMGKLMQGKCGGMK